VTQEIREKIIERFMENVYGKKPETSRANQRHDGKKGHWLEDQMGIEHDADNAPDLWDYECKNETKSKTTFGDWQGDYLIWRDPERFSNLKNITGEELRLQQGKNKDEVFLPAFGRWRDAKENEKYLVDGQQVGWKNKGFFSWSWVRKVEHGFGKEGQRLVVNNDNSISIVYSYSHDTRSDKDQRVPERFHVENLKLVGWSHNRITELVENKFGASGWFKCLMNKQGIYNAIIFGEPIFIDKFVQAVKDSKIFFDTRMKERRPNGTDRMGMNWRAGNNFWVEMSNEKSEPPIV